MLITISGTPGTGKTAVAKILAKQMKARLIDTGYLVKKYKIKTTMDRKRNTKIIDTKKLEGNKINLTYAGRIIKPFYFDELPQLFNILKGDMSLVGPRPVAPANSERLISKGLYSKKLIKAGLTGYFQAQKDKIPPPNQEESDMAYIDFCRDNSGWRIVMEDIKIILSTVLTVLRAKGVYRHHI